MNMIPLQVANIAAFLVFRTERSLLQLVYV